ncbi:hypothetical protein [Mucilaginibacter sp.]|uniref:hypothetical protein n=1 Tax=Mucilaginibacter sp. TaxID=1882438 RepID=UPI0025DB06BF|nr:hypothetical protein [Mucilaginibacter sp.]
MVYSQELKEKLPHGSGKVIAKIAGVNEQSVSKFLNGKTRSLKLEKAVLEFIAELDQQRDKVLNPGKGNE